MVNPILTYFIRIEEETWPMLRDRTSDNSNIDIKYINEALSSFHHEGTLLFRLNMNENDATALKLAIPTVGWINFDSTSQSGNVTIN
jgi:hypothetical protein